MTENIFSKLAKATSQMPNPKLDKTNPRFNSRYATLESVQLSVKPALSSNGLVDWVDFDSTSQEWKLMLSDGSEVIELVSLPTSGFTNIQSVGSESTYAGRYLRCNAYFLVGEEDDDGNAASDVDKSSKSKQAPKPQKAPHLQPIRDMIGEFARHEGVSTSRAASMLAAHMGVASVSDIPAEAVSAALAYMRERIERS